MHGHGQAARLQIARHVVDAFGRIGARSVSLPDKPGHGYDSGDAKQRAENNHGDRDGCMEVRKSNSDYKERDERKLNLRQRNKGNASQKRT